MCFHCLCDMNWKEYVQPTSSCYLCQRLGWSILVNGQYLLQPLELGPHVNKAFGSCLNSCGCCNKLRQTWWLKTTCIYSLMVLQVTSSSFTGLNSWWRQSCAACRGIRSKQVSLPFLASACLSAWLLSSSREQHLLQLYQCCLLLWSNFPLFHLIRTLVIAFWAHLDNSG